MKQTEDQKLSSSENSSDGETGSLINWKLVDRIAKLFVVGVILLLCVNLLQSMFYVAPPRVKRDRSDQPVSPGHETIDANQQLFNDFTRGSWSFGDGNWQLRVYPETNEQGMLMVPSNRRLRNPMFDDQEIIAKFEALGARPSRVVEDFEIWESTHPGFSFVLITCDSVVQVVRTRYNSGNGFSIVEGKPHTEEAAENELLMPIAEGVRQVATRADVSGQTSSAILKIEPDFSGDLRSIWKQNGWNVKPLPVVTAGEAQAERYHCTNAAGVLIEAVFFLNETTQRPQQVLLNCLPGLPD